LGDNVTEKTVAGGGAEEQWRQVEHLLLPGARPEIERLVREVRDYLAAEDNLAAEGLDDSTALRRNRRTVAKRVDRAVTALFAAFRDLRLAPRVDPDLRPENTVMEFESDAEVMEFQRNAQVMEFQRDAERFQKQWVPYLLSLQHRARSRAHDRKRRGPGRNYLLAGVVAQLMRIIETHRLDKDQKRKRTLLARDRVTGAPYGVLFDVAAALRDFLPCLPRGDEALYKALTRAKKRLGPHRAKNRP
jgi:hypothetical protein